MCSGSSAFAACSAIFGAHLQSRSVSEPKDVVRSSHLQRVLTTQLQVGRLKVCACTPSSSLRPVEERLVEPPRPCAEERRRGWEGRGVDLVVHVDLRTNVAELPYDVESRRGASVIDFRAIEQRQFARKLDDLVEARRPVDGALSCGGNADKLGNPTAFGQFARCTCETIFKPVLNTVKKQVTYYFSNV